MDIEKSMHLLHIPTGNQIGIRDETLPQKLGFLLLLVFCFTIILLDQLYSNKPIPIGLGGTAILILVTFLIVSYVYWVTFDLTTMCIHYIRRFRAKINK